ncbi:asparaginase [Natrarchaeobius oligotrophus]|uniref:Plant-type L-asparaginase n=1 Tax=Natrarchaeobius chitinivorans TaxID=1679083 RepID=A0A3N6MRS7_NATCH|nr:asparaginase [Natrarchaeobius chitinivorans]
MQVLVHGGAGSTPDEPKSRQRVLERAAEHGGERSNPVDAVEAAVNVLESSPRFNAGLGGAIQSDGEIRTDAGIMTDDRAVGAVCSMPRVERAVSVARIVMEETPHGFVSGEHAVALADAFDVETGVDLRSDRTRERWGDLDSPPGDVEQRLEWIRDRYGRSDPDGKTNENDRSRAANGGRPDGLDHDTVGAVAVDGERLATATSTGGRWLALADDVGDVK